MDDKIESKILGLFQIHNKLKFNKIEKQLNIRSNKLAYHLLQLIKKQILTKENEHYQLSETAENLIPYLSDKKAVLPVILIQIRNKNNVFLYQREKRPFKDKLSLPGGRLILGESIKQAVSRIMKDNFNINCKLKKIDSISLEHVKKKGKIIHSFLLIFGTATTNQEVQLTDITKNKSKIISSDYKLITTKSNSEIKISEIFTQTS